MNDEITKIYSILNVLRCSVIENILRNCYYGFALSHNMVVSI